VTTGEMRSKSAGIAMQWVGKLRALKCGWANAGAVVARRSDSSSTLSYLSHTKRGVSYVSKHYVTRQCL